MPHTEQPHALSRPLPPYRGVLAVDAKDFTGYPAVQHGPISRAIPQLLRSSFERAGIHEVWEDRRFPGSTGDGYVFGFDPAVMPFVVHPWLATLQDVLAEFNMHSAGVVRIRLRVSLNIGPLPDTGDEFDGNGTPRNDTHRLLDSRPVKAVLAASSANVTQVAAILSDRCYQDVVASGYTGRHPDHFIEVPATVEGKPFAQRAWLYVPAPSGNLYDRRVLGDRVVEDREKRGPDGGPRSRAASPRTPGAPRSVIRADRGNVNSGTVHGGQNVSNVDVGRDHIGGDRIGRDQIGGDHVGGNKAGTVGGNQGDTVHGDKYGDAR
ncbi:hypothetical protein LUX01_12670 [Streptomyces sudanensis]|uniref:hypothetical protein n=1 Tax=Streptomyces sudanensis TaxID=436397 RepID=UPI0020CD5161|nr:hypothetical protein [Streptomyces sudanensis]MCP9987422.1 hypothetical protein [Streptomyces sudanensis]